MVVADTVNHALRGSTVHRVRSRTLAGTGKQWMDGDGTDVLTSPWDVAWWQDKVWIAMAGIHQLWTFDPLTGEHRGRRRDHQRGPGDGPPPRPGSPRLPGSRPTAIGSGSPTPRFRAALDRHRGAHRRRTGPVRLRPPRRQGRRGAAPAPARRGRPAGRVDRRRRHLQPRRTPLSTRARRRSARWRRDLPEVSGLVVAGAGLVAVESAAHRLSLVATSTAVSASGTARTTSRRPLTSPPRPRHSRSCSRPRPGRSSTTGSDRAPACSSTPTPPALLAEGGGRDTDLHRRW